MKKVWAWTLAGTLFFTLAAPLPGAWAATKVTLNKEKIVLEEEGDETTITATVSSDDDDAVVSWYISDNDVISISPSKGSNRVTIEADEIGVAKLRASYGGVRDEAIVIVQGSVEDDPGDTAPADFQGERVDSETIRWTWTDLSNDEDGFIIYDEDDEEVGRVDENETEWEEDGLDPDTEYTRYVRAYKDDEKSAKSEEATERTMDEDEEESSASGVSRSDVTEGLEDAFDEDPDDPKIKFADAEDLEDENSYEVALTDNMAVVFPYESLDGYEGSQVVFEEDQLTVKMDEEELTALKSDTAYAFWFRKLDGEDRWDSASLLSPVYDLRLARIESDGDGASLEDTSATLEFEFRNSNGATIDLWRYSDSQKKWEKIKTDLYDRGGFVVVTLDKLGKYLFAKGGFDPEKTASSTPAPPVAPEPAPVETPVVPVTFTDISGHWAAADIEYMAAKGLVSGRGNGLFAPDSTITRAEFVTLLNRVLNLGTPSTTESLPFRDVPGNAWYYDDLATVYQAGIIPWGTTTFRPDEPIRREDAAAWLGRAALHKGIKPIVSNPPVPTDWSKVTASAKNDIAFALQTGLIKGRPNGALDPSATLTRAEGTVVLKGLYTR